MKQILLLLLITTSTLCYSQAIEYGKLTPKGDFTEYRAKSGDIVKVGDTLILGKRSLDRCYNHIIDKRSQKLATPILGYPMKIIKFKAYDTEKQGYKVFAIFKSWAGGQLMIDYESAIKVREVKKPGAMTRSEAIYKLRKAKELLNAGKITQDRYDDLLKELNQIID